MRQEKTFEVAVPVEVAHRAWRRFGQASESAPGGQVRFEPVGKDRTRVRLALEQERERLEKTVEDFISFVEGSGGEDAAPRQSPGASGAGMSDLAGREAFPRRKRSQ